MTLAHSLEMESVQVFTRPWVEIAGADPRGITSMGVRSTSGYFLGVPLGTCMEVWNVTYLSVWWATGLIGILILGIIGRSG